MNLTQTNVTPADTEPANPAPLANAHSKIAVEFLHQRRKILFESLEPRLLLSADLDFAISENPTLRLVFVPRGGAALRAEVGDTQGLAWSLGLLAWVRFQQRRVAEAQALGAQDIAGYFRAGGQEAMPRCLLLIDEFQEFFTEDDRVAQNAALLLDSRAMPHLHQTRVGIRRLRSSRFARAPARPSVRIRSIWACSRTRPGSSSGFER